MSSDPNRLFTNPGSNLNNFHNAFGGILGGFNPAVDDSKENSQKSANLESREGQNQASQGSQGLGIKGRQEAGLSQEDRRDLFVDDNAPMSNNQFFNVDAKQDAHEFN